MYEHAFSSFEETKTFQFWQNEEDHWKFWAGHVNNFYNYDEPKKIRDTPYIVSLYPQIYQDYIEYFNWCKSYCGNYWKSGTTCFAFQSKNEAALFKLSYGELNNPCPIANC